MNAFHIKKSAIAPTLIQPKRVTKLEPRPSNLYITSAKAAQPINDRNQALRKAGI